MFNSHVALIESIARLGLALILGSVIGFERQWHQKMAGLRTIDAALEQIVGRLSLEPHITAATWAVDRAIPET
jgi:MgtC family